MLMGGIAFDYDGVEDDKDFGWKLRSSAVQKCNSITARSKDGKVKYKRKKEVESGSTSAVQGFARDVRVV